MFAIVIAAGISSRIAGMLLGRDLPANGIAVGASGMVVGPLVPLW